MERGNTPGGNNGAMVTSFVWKKVDTDMIDVHGLLASGGKARSTGLRAGRRQIERLETQRPGEESHSCNLVCGTENVLCAPPIGAHQRVPTTSEAPDKQ